MLKTEDNEILTQVGPGTPMGELLRRYWTPACLSAEIPEPGGAPARVRLLGENLVYVVPYHTMVAIIPWNQRHGLFVPMDDGRTARYSFAVKAPRNIQGYGGANLFAVAPFSTPISRGRRQGIIPREFRADNDYQIDREVQRTATFSGVADFVSQDLMVTESMGPIYDRTQEQLGSTDKAVTRMRHILISAAKGLAAGKEPPAVGERDYRSIFGAEKILEPGEDWRVLATPEDPTFAAALEEEAQRA